MSSLTGKACSSCLLSPRSQWILRIQFRFRRCIRAPSLSILLGVWSEFLLGHVRIIALLFSYLLLVVTALIFRCAIRDFWIIHLSLSRHRVLISTLGILTKTTPLCETTPQSITAPAGFSCQSLEYALLQRLVRRRGEERLDALN